MPIAEPTDPLYLAVKQQYDGWPPDSEEAAWQLGLAWAQAGEKIAAAGAQVGQVGQTVTTAWPDPAGAAAAGKIREHAQQVAGLQTGLGQVAQSVNGYGTALLNTKNAITQTIQSNSSLYAALPLPALQTVFAAMVAANVRQTVEDATNQLQKLKVEALSAEGLKGSFAKDGKEVEYKAGANLEKVTGQFDDGKGSWEVTTGADVGAGAGLNSKEGAYAKVEGGAGVTAQGQFNDKAGAVGYGVKGEGFYGLKAGAGAQAGPEGVKVGADVLLGAKATGRGQVSFAGLTVGGTVEGSAGIGANADYGFSEDKSGAWHLHGKAGATPGVGGSAGVDVTFDPSEFSKSVDEAAHSVGDFGKRVAGGF